MFHFHDVKSPDIHLIEADSDWNFEQVWIKWYMVIYFTSNNLVAATFHFSAWKRASWFHSNQKDLATRCLISNRVMVLIAQMTHPTNQFLPTLHTTLLQIPIPYSHYRFPLLYYINTTLHRSSHATPRNAVQYCTIPHRITTSHIKSSHLSPHQPSTQSGPPPPD